MENICVYCGDIIPEGRMVCPNCEAKISAKSIKVAEKEPHGRPNTPKYRNDTRRHALWKAKRR